MWLGENNAGRGRQCKLNAPQTNSCKEDRSKKISTDNNEINEGVTLQIQPSEKETYNVWTHNRERL
jgi:hypothetical protein